METDDTNCRGDYINKNFRDLYEAEFHIGKSTIDNVQEYRQHSPAWSTPKFDCTPLLILTNTNNDDVNVLKVEHLMEFLNPEGNNPEYDTLEALPIEHSFDGKDTNICKEIRLKVHQHLAKMLKPERPFKSLKDQQKAGYKY